MVLDNGTVLAFTLQQEHQVTAWTRQAFNGAVKDICSVSGDTQDEIFMLTDNKLVVLNHRADKAGAFTPQMYLDDGTTAYTTSFESMELEQNVNGSLQGRHKHVPGAALRLFRSCNLKAGIMTENSGALDTVLEETTPYTGDVYVRLPGGVGRTCRVRVENDAPAPVTLLGIFQEVEVDG
jgi:hypothetical protein